MFRTYEPTRDRLVAVKVFRLDVIPELAQALADELSRAAEAGLFHPSIVEPIAAGVEGTVAYRAEEYVAAESLDVAMRHYAPAALDKALPFLTQLAGAIDFARAAGVGHGSLHPRDIFVTPDEARATGFGVVQAMERVGLRAPVRRPYSAPERIRGGPWSTPADVFSLAAIAFELLTAKRPSGTGDDIGSLDGSLLSARAAAVHAVLARAMHEDPDHRFQTTLAFAAALEAASHGQPATDAVADVAAIAAPVRVAPERAPSTAAPPPEPPEPRNLTEPPEPRNLTEPPEPRNLTEPPEPRNLKEPRNLTEPQEPAEPSDIALEREDDEAQHALFLREQAAVDSGTADRDPELFDQEAEADLAFVAEHPEPFADEFATGDESGRIGRESASLLALDDEIREAEPAAVELAGADDPRAYTPVEEEVREDPRVAAAAGAYAARPSVFRDAVADERPRPAMLPVAIMLVIGMSIAFAAGYMVRDRTASGSPPAVAAQPQAAPSAQVATGSQKTGKEWSEQQVSPPSPSAPPPVPAETGAPAGKSPAAPDPKLGALVVRSTPSGASVTVNGRWRGRTPLTLDDLRFGPYTVRVVQPGYGVAREEFTLSAGEPRRTMSVRLRRTAAPPPQPAATPARTSSRPAIGTGSIYVDSRPRGARVFVDGRAVGVTPLRLGDVRAGSHTVRLELDEHRTWTASRYVLAGQETRVTGSLDRIR